MDDTQERSSGRTAGLQQDPAPTLPQAQLTGILDHLSDPLYIVDEHWRITYLNRKAKAEEVWGRRRDDLRGKHVWEEWPQAVGTDTYHQLLAAMRERRSAELEYQAPTANRWFDIRAEPSGKGLVVSFSDITARKRVEESLREANERIEMILDSITDNFFGLSKDWRFTYFNKHSASRGWRPSIAATSLSFRWMTSATGIAITTSLPKCSLRICWRSSPIR